MIISSIYDPSDQCSFNYIWGIRWKEILVFLSRILENNLLCSLICTLWVHFPMYFCISCISCRCDEIIFFTFYLFSLNAVFVIISFNSILVSIKIFISLPFAICMSFIARWITIHGIMAAAKVLSLLNMSCMNIILGYSFTCTWQGWIPWKCPICIVLRSTFITAMILDGMVISTKVKIFGLYTWESTDSLNTQISWFNISFPEVVQLVPIQYFFKKCISRINGLFKCLHTIKSNI